MPPVHRAQPGLPDGQESTPAACSLETHAGLLDRDDAISRQGVPAGCKFTIAGVACYVVEPRSGAGVRDQALILIPDATGGGNPETRLLAGEYLGRL